MSQLKILLVHSNQLEGRALIQDVLPQLTQLEWLCINGNLLSGSIATEIGLLSSLQKLELQDTNLSGTLPKELVLLDNLTSLVVMNTSLTGSIPDGLCGVIVSSLEMKPIGGNDYTVPATNLRVFNLTLFDAGADIPISASLMESRKSSFKFFRSMRSNNWVESASNAASKPARTFSRSSLHQFVDLSTAAASHTSSGCRA
ncbi:LRR receptor-like serine threonine-protein kinase [Seminavis robusta]|uniref:LRR receptor-like serine threonine-protein kinase n=1 Tax=Seminavis robusta TaxID=568900 RepID=A0A9N8DXW4_9STRA|nr:LRR receptor-like serine threonine-protein kinase [Seminavis robusta]|eukprot:Sro432_g141690.1 LRR receptor-like serine threonine-protein kinase (201) ;mRNA; r:47539-48393